MIKLLGIRHQHHGNSDGDDSIEVDDDSSFSIRKVAEEGSSEELNDNIEANDEGISEILDLVFFIDLKFLLEEQRLKGVYADKDER